MHDAELGFKLKDLSSGGPLIEELIWKLNFFTPFWGGGEQK